MKNYIFLAHYFFISSVLSDPTPPDFVALVGKGDMFPCLGILVSPKHVLTNLECVRIAQNRMNVSMGRLYNPRQPKNDTFDRSVVATEYEVQDISSIRNYLARNYLAVLTIDAPLNYHVTPLVEQTLGKGTKLKLLAWYKDCQLRQSKTEIIERDLEIVDEKNCNSLESDEFCVREIIPSTDDNILHAGLVFTEDYNYLVGFSLFGCNRPRKAVTNIFKHKTFVTNAL